MELPAFFLAQLEREAAVSRRVLESVPEGRGDWKPHEKSMALGRLATVVATMPSWFALILDQDELDLAPPGGAPAQPPQWSRIPDLLEMHEQSIARGKDALQRTSAAQLAKPWRLLVAAKAVSESPRHVVVADTFNHLAHHRGQLSVYLRLNGVPVPSVYGPSADDARFA